ncbi:hypothetical protein [Comamonas denitrificans]|uniref:hypothetical protein n=1 Tax=Comamonas denitrificans TaxID=117506 RepID=UPI003616D6DE
MKNINILDGAGTVINTILATENFAEQHYPGHWRLAEHQPEPQEPVSQAPASCTPTQGLIALYTLKQITEQDIFTALETITDPVARYTAKIGYQRATQWERRSATMQLMAQLLELSEDDLDALFSYAVGVCV